MSDDRSTVPRRTYLRAVTGLSAVSIGALAGCLEEYNSTEERDEGGPSDSEGTDDDESANEQTGRLDVRMATDPSTSEAFESCSVTIDGFGLVPTADGESDRLAADSDGNESPTDSSEESTADDGPVPRSYAFDDSRTIELVDSGPNAIEVLDDRDLPIGSYQSLLFDVSSVDGVLHGDGGATIALPEDRPFQFSVPFDIRADTTTTFVASVVSEDGTGADEYVLRPFSDGTIVRYGDDGNQRAESDGDTDDSETDTDGSRDPITDQIQIVHAVGHVSPAETVTTLELTVMKAPGSDVVDLSPLSIEFSDSTTTATLSYGGDGQRGDATADTFVTTHIAGDGSYDKLVSTEDRVTITLDASLVRGDDGLPPGSSATVAFVDPAGERYTYGVSIPSTFGDKSVVPA